VILAIGGLLLCAWCRRSSQITRFNEWRTRVGRAASGTYNTNLGDRTSAHLPEIGGPERAFGVERGDGFDAPGINDTTMSRADVEEMDENGR
jgi:hypothetical protein